jgi:hypothetical protein
VANPTPGVEVRQVRSGAPVRRIGVAHLDDNAPPPSVRAMIAIRRDVTRRLTAKPAAPRRA